LTTNYRLPFDVDRKNLEKHLTESEFEMVFKMSKKEFYQMLPWRRAELKKKCYLF